MKARSFICFAIILLINLALIHSQLNAQMMIVSYYTSLKEAFDVVIVKVNSIEGEEYGKKAIAHVERSFKGKVKNHSIELPFVYTDWTTANGSHVLVSDMRSVSFEVGKRYIVLLQKGDYNLGNPHAAKTEYITFDHDEIKYDYNNQIPRLEKLLAITEQSDTNVIVDSFLSLVQSDSLGMRNEAIQALIDLKSKKAANSFIALLRNDPNPNIRYRVALGLGYIHSDSVASALIECLGKELVKYVRYQIIGSLGMIRARKAAPILLGLYESEEYDMRNAILESVSRLEDSTVVPTLLHLFSIDQDLQHRHLIAQTIAFYHTPEADSFSTTLLDSSKIVWLKNAVIDGWRESGYTKGFNQILKWTTILCTSKDHSSNYMTDLQNLIFPLFYAIEILGTPEQIASTLKPFANCSNPSICQNAARILTELLKKDISNKLRKEVEEEIKTFPSQ